MMLSFEDKKVTIVLLIFVAFFGMINLNRDLVGMSFLDFVLDEKDFDIREGVIDLNSLTLKQKIGQMIFTLAIKENRDLLQKMNIGGIYFGEKKSEDIYKEEIMYFQKGMEIPFFVGTDLEGCWNPFWRFKDFKKFGEVSDETDAYYLGMEHGKVLRELGFNINFSPVVDREDRIWKCRCFKDNVEGNAVYYIKGLQGQDVIATAKHYPGKTLVGKDPHKDVEFAFIEDRDLRPFDLTIKNGVKAIMVNHLISDGEVNSGYKPSVVSENVISNLRKDFKGLVLSDEVRMAGLEDYYGNEREMYVDLINAGNDVILDFSTEPWHFYKVIYILENAVKNNEVKEERINEAVTKILEMKGFEVRRR